jgi:hypothetical protein
MRVPWQRKLNFNMRFLIRYFSRPAKALLVLILCLCVLSGAVAQHKKSHKKSSSSSSGHKSGSSKHKSGSSSHKSGSSKHKSSGSSHGKKSKHGSSKSSKSSHGKKTKHSRGRGKHHYTAFNDEPDENTYVPIQPVTDHSELRETFVHPPEAAKPWVFWYWNQGAISREGITLDLQAMKDAGIGGAYLMTIKGAGSPPLINPPVEQLTPQWWQMVKFAMSEADRLGVKLAMHDCDGFAVAGGPWITPDISMQKLTWSRNVIHGGRTVTDTLAMPQANEGYYRDVAVYAYPLKAGEDATSENTAVTVSTSKAGDNAQYLAQKGNKKSFGSDTTCYIQYSFAQPFTCRSITIHTNGNNYEAQRLALQVSDDGEHFTPYTNLEPARAGWQDGDAPNTYAIPVVTAKYFRFIYEKAGTEPGSEDLESAKWKPNLKIQGITLYSAPQLNQYEGKNGEVWRVAAKTTQVQIPDNECVPMKELTDISKFMDARGRLNWNAPAGDWVVLRMGHTSTGHKNETGGAAKGLECDKFNPEAVKLQFNNWYAEAIRQAGPDLAARVLKIFHVDSWECASQNWTPLFRQEFSKRRGYDPIPYLPAMAGVPLGSAGQSEKFLHDVRQTIAELLVDNFFHVMAGLAHEKGATFSAESVAPTMVSDGLLHFKEVDIPMGEFWLRSPTHDKPGDILDAVSGGHIYGKPLIQVEAFTEVRMAWDEYPGALKTLADRNFALGINRFVLHVFNHNPWPDRKPGMTLDGVGTFFQRDQTWWKPGKAFIDYLARCQTLLQLGNPVTDIAVFTSEEIPSRSVLPDRLVSILPGIFGADVVTAETKRLQNVGEPMRTIPDGVSSSANMADADNWVNPLRGYAYDSFNTDALLRLASVKDGRIVLPGGASYKILILPGVGKMTPNGDVLSKDVLAKVQQLVNDGATVIVNGQKLQASLQSNRIIKAPYTEETFSNLGLERDVIVTDTLQHYAKNIAWTHRATADGTDIYFIANQEDGQRIINLSLRVANKVPEMWDAVTGETYSASGWTNENGRTSLTLRLEHNGSYFIVLRNPAHSESRKGRNWSEFKNVRSLDGVWSVQFDPKFGGPDEPVQFTTLTDWSKSDIPSIKYYSGTADYLQTVKWNSNLVAHRQLWLDLGAFANIASVTINGIYCGTAWSPPYRVDITGALHNGYNKVHVEVSNTWHNRLIKDHTLPEEKRVTNTTAPFRLEGKPLLPAGLFGPVRVVEIDKNN